MLHNPMLRKTNALKIAIYMSLSSCSNAGSTNEDFDVVFDGLFRGNAKKH